MCWNSEGFGEIAEIAHIYLYQVCTSYKHVHFYYPVGACLTELQGVIEKFVSFSDTEKSMDFK